MKVTNENIVRVKYVGKYTNGEIFDRTTGDQTLDVPLGKGMVIPGFEEALIGMSAGESKHVTIPVEKAYGEHNPERVQVIDKSMVPDEVEVGQMLQTSTPQGTINVKVVEVNETTLKLDANHPLVGKELIFDLTVVEILEQVKNDELFDIATITPNQYIKGVMTSFNCTLEEAELSLNKLLEDKS